MWRDEQQPGLFPLQRFGVMSRPPSAARLAGVRPAFPNLERLAQGRPLSELSLTFDCDPPTYHGFRRLQLQPGVVTADAVEMFGFHKCHLLAAAVHEVTGWRFCLLHQWGRNGWTWTHSGMLTLDGRFLDIHGFRPAGVVIGAVEAELKRAVAMTHHASYADAHAAITAAPLAPWTMQIDPVFVEVVRCFADTLISWTEYPT